MEFTHCLINTSKLKVTPTLIKTTKTVEDDMLHSCIAVIHPVFLRCSYQVFIVVSQHLKARLQL